MPSIVSDSDLIYTGQAQEQPPIVDFDWVLMSQGMFRDLTD